jgi:hypothetical protein
MVNWSRSLSPIRERLGFLGDGDEAIEDLIDVGEDEDDGETWVPVRDLIYRWHRSEAHREAAGIVGRRWLGRLGSRMHRQWEDGASTGGRGGYG